MAQITNNVDYKDFSETEEEMALACGFDTLEEAQQAIAQITTYERFLIDLLPGAIDYMRNEQYKGEEVSEEFLLEEAKALVEDQAHMFAFD